MVQGGMVQGGIVKGGIVKGEIVKGGIVKGEIVKGGIVKGGIVKGGIVKGEIVKGEIVKGETMNWHCVPRGTGHVWPDVRQAMCGPMYGRPCVARCTAGHVHKTFPWSRGHAMLVKDYDA